MTFDGTLKFDTAIDKSGFEAGLDKLGSIAKSGMAVVGGAVAAVGAGMAALGGYAVSVGSGFEHSMSQVIATMGITRDTIQDGVNSFDLLSDAAKAAGESTTFSASEAADALNYLALAGYSAEQAADALPAVLDLAAAGGMELARASDLATDAMAALGIEANKENLTHFGDELARTASKANTNVAQLGEAILTVGGTAKSLKGGTVELNAALGVLANRGIKGAEGGTKLRNMILSLSAPTDVARARLDALGIATLDAEGNLRGLNEIFGDLDKALTGMTDAQKTSVLNDIFNKTDIAAAQGMLAGCGDEFNDLTAAIGECDGAMSDMAKTMNDNLEGDIKSLQSKAEALGVSLYEGMTAPLRSLVQDAGSYISQVKEAYENADIGEGDLAGIASAMWSALGSNIVTGITDGIKEHAGEIADTLILTLIRLPDAAADIVPELMEIGESLLTGLTDGMERRANLAAFVGQTLMERILPAITDNLGRMLDAGADLVKMLLTGIKDAVPKLLTIAKTILQTVARALIDNLPELLVLGGEILGELVLGLIGALPDIVGVAVQLITMLADFVGENLDPLLSAAAVIITALGEALLDPSMLASVIEVAGKLLTAIIEGLTGDGIGELQHAVLGLVPVIIDTLLDPELIGQLAETGALLVAELVKGMCVLAETSAGEFVLLVEEIGRVLGEQDWAALGMALINGVLDGAGSVDFDAFWDNWFSGLDDIKTFFGDVKTSCEEGWKSITEWASEAWTNAKISVGSFIADLVTQGEEGAADLKQKIVDGLQKLPEDMLNIGKNIVTGLGNGILSMADWLGGTISGFSGGILDKFKGALGIQSPSKLMRDLIGKNLALGIGVGFETEMPEVGEDAVQAAKDAFTLPKIEPELLMPELPELGKPVISDIPELSAVIRPELLMPELPELSAIIRPELSDFPEMPELPMTGGMLQAEIDPAVLRLIETAASMPLPVQAPAAQQIIHNSYAYSSTTNTTQATEPQPQQSGDIIVPVYLGNDTLVTAVVKALQIANAQSGGVTI
ncbi:MAG: phage tail tape measure protein [Oscillospiraceae bacterium]|nr:phage tail tape measure protein [Oscillospiraceae bacterium]